MGSSAGRRDLRSAIVIVVLIVACLAQIRATLAREAVLLDVTGAIGPATTDYLRRGFRAAADRNAALVVLRMDTPGGLDAATREIVRDILASPLPIVAYVGPSGARAASAGTYILYACHLAGMAPGTNLGAATPVQLGGGPQPLGRRSRNDGRNDQDDATTEAHTAKAVNDAAAYIRGLAELRGRDADWAERAVRSAASLSAKAALEQGVIEILAVDLQDLLRQADGRVVRVGQQGRKLETTGLGIIAVEPDWRERFLATITDPNIAYILMLIGIYGVLFELAAAPGTVLPGVIGAICLLVGLFALNLLPISYAGAGLVLLGIALMVAEAFAPSLVLGTGGIAAFVIGSVLMFDSGAPGFSLSWPVVATATAATAALLLVVLAAAIRAHRHRVVTGEAALLGSPGEVLTWAGQEGEVWVHGERWRARAAAPLTPGQRVRVTARDRLVLVVEPGADRPARG
ncbi:MAG TPA: nodulation protein NfeD [Crenalkalicoccus sp.]|jgi:membrane-bound serine protease (ClpP class)|nr:nodulation protein NfeD [Crenalkalicoccus sp.]